MIAAVIERCAGIDVGKTFLTVCLLTGPADGEPKAETRKFGTFHADLAALGRWVVRGEMHAGRHGKHRLLLEAGVQYTGNICDSDSRQRAGCKRP